MCGCLFSQILKLMDLNVCGDEAVSPYICHTMPHFLYTLYSCLFSCFIFISLFVLKTDKGQATHFQQLFQILLLMGHSWADR